MTFVIPTTINMKKKKEKKKMHTISIKLVDTGSSGIIFQKKNLSVYEYSLLPRVNYVHNTVKLKEGKDVSCYVYVYKLLVYFIMIHLSQIDLFCTDIPWLCIYILSSQ